MFSEFNLSRPYSKRCMLYLDVRHSKIKVGMVNTKNNISFTSNQKQKKAPKKTIYSNKWHTIKISALSPSTVVGCYSL